MGKSNKNNSLINKLLKAKKYIVIPLSIIMMTSGLSACSGDKDVEKNQGDTALSYDTNEDYKSTTIKINDREYVFDDEGATYIVKDENDNMWEVSRDLNVSYEELEDANDIDPYKLQFGDEIKVPKNLFNYGSKMGLFASEALGTIDWEKVSCVCDFAFINYYDFRNDHEDSNFLENVRGCEENCIPYGIVVYGGIKENELFDSEKIGKKDAKFVSDVLEKNNASMPTLFILAKDGINYDNASSIFEEDDFFFFSNNDDMNDGLVGFINNEETSVQAEKYCSSFFNTMKKDYGNFTILYTSDSAYDALYEIYENNYKNIDQSSKNMLELILDAEGNYNPTVGNQIIFNMFSKVEGDKQCLEAKSKFDLLGVDDSKEVCVFYDDSPSDKLFTISRDFKKANDDRILGERRTSIIFYSIMTAIFSKQVVDIYKILKSKNKEEITDASENQEKGISKVKRKNKKK